VGRRLAHTPPRRAMRRLGRPLLLHSQRQQIHTVTNRKRNAAELPKPANRQVLCGASRRLGPSFAALLCTQGHQTSKCSLSPLAYTCNLTDGRVHTGSKVRHRDNALNCTHTPCTYHTQPHNVPPAGCSKLCTCPAAPTLVSYTTAMQPYRTRQQHQLRHTRHA
jgi:hypothetical protein